MLIHPDAIASHTKQQHAYATHDQQALRVDKNTAVTPIKRKNYSTDPSRAIVLEAFAVEKSVRVCACRMEGREVYVSVRASTDNARR